MSELEKVKRLSKTYPIILSEYNPTWPEWYREEKGNLERLIGTENIKRISHYGSTAVPGLTAKPTIDILLEINETVDIDNLIDALPSEEYICLDEAKLTIPTPPPHLMFLKGYLPHGFAEKVYHIHVVYPGDHDELWFRDYLIAHPEIATEYGTLKRRLFLEYEYDRDGYTEGKGEFVKRITGEARKEGRVCD
ncbi:MAG: GrpB family protein [Firmicutes bacterium]|nr:GrpB family protein [Bacillota bacterium]